MSLVKEKQIISNSSKRFSFKKSKESTSKNSINRRHGQLRSENLPHSFNNFVRDRWASSTFPMMHISRFLKLIVPTLDGANTWRLTISIHLVTTYFELKQLIGFCGTRYVLDMPSTALETFWHLR
ncbi:hypothetical protein AVEN_11986-1 [Araneus ventricosus]|uniref:Uncharacterized protein n=1 Tax=Araneus ventricosus TaxID=182803 RepID=A0A4Y2JZ60_ARAVE|nr:hypothetical protein AVEN_11986-1 [Araneus ventricosus]